MIWMVPVPYPNCAALHVVYPHGVARPGAHDVAPRGTTPVTTFVVNQRMYAVNRRLDRDHDGVACEKR